MTTSHHSRGGCADRQGRYYSAATSKWHSPSAPLRGQAHPVGVRRGTGSRVPCNGRRLAILALSRCACHAWCGRGGRRAATLGSWSLTGAQGRGHGQVLEPGFAARTSWSSGPDMPSRGGAERCRLGRPAPPAAGMYTLSRATIRPSYPAHVRHHRSRTSSRLAEAVLLELSRCLRCVPPRICHY